jgi:uncharacterized protein YifE (UPF0438 family)
MKLLSKLVASFLFCFTWQNSHSQFFYPEYKAEEYLPPYDPNVVIISPDVEKWMNEQLENKEGNKRVVKMKTDILGRVKSGSDGVGQEKIVEGKQKRLVVVSDMHIREHEEEAEYGRYEYNMETKKRNYFLNGKQMSEKEYFEYQNKSLEKFKQQKKGKRDLSVSGAIGSDDRTWTAWMTAEEISELTKNYKELAIDDYVEPKNEASYTSILSYLQLSTHAFPTYGGNGIGVYVSEMNCVNPAMRIVNPSKHTISNTCKGEVDNHYNGVVNIVQRASPMAHVFSFSGGNNYPSNPFSYSPPIEIGTHSYGHETALYETSDMNMDNYIYNNRVINFKSAGNNRNSSIVTSPGKAVNAITVGAIDPVTNKYKDYSSWKNAAFKGTHYLGDGSDKPEIAMYTDVDDYVFMDGTSAAAPLAAGFTATLLDQHPVFKRKPALVKAVLLTGETIPIQNPSWDSDNYTKIKGIVNYSSVACGWRSRWWDGTFISSSKEISFTEDNIQANKRYRIAIAWLVSGSSVFSAGKLPDIDLYVEQNGKRIASSISTRNAFEIVDFFTTSNAPFTIIIKPVNSSGNVILGYHLRENF